ncbi:hypothetical protein TNCV_2144121 [Trichonephila clavipes]|nr:hypothetical protein TNCV_2144121 [Trichonephila clavipes]
MIWRIQGVLKVPWVDRRTTQVLHINNSFSPGVDLSRRKDHVVFPDPQDRWLGHGHKFESSSGVTEDPRHVKEVDAHYIRQGSKSLLLCGVKI